tara:strand:- start:3859 stop:4095 length:237 start_codon:yes stop_codon:yes gene_type:complete
MIEESTEVFWKKRYDVMQDEYRRMQRENEMMFEVMTKVKSHVSLGNIVEAVGTIKDLVEKLKDNPRASKQTNRRYKYD